MEAPRWRHPLLIFLISACIFLALPLFRGDVGQVVSEPRARIAHLPSIVMDASNGEAPFDPVSRPDIPDWMALHAEYVEEVKELVQTDPDLDVLFYGDSITEFARGTCMGHEHCQDKVHDVWLHIIGNNYKAHILAISGDQTPHLLWRLKNGELSTHLKPKVVVILIGTNDLGNVVRCKSQWHQWGGKCAGVSANLTETAGRAAATIGETVKELLSQVPGAQVLLQAVLPRGFKDFRQPSLFTEPISLINEHLKKLAGASKQVHYVDCGADFLSQDGSQITESFMPDALHPSPTGEVFMLMCLKASIDQLLPPPAPTTSTRPKQVLRQSRRSGTSMAGSQTSKASSAALKEQAQQQERGSMARAAGLGEGGAVTPLVDK